MEKVAAVWSRLNRHREFYWILWVLFFLGATNFAAHFLRHAEPGAFYQRQFSPAVMQACGRGFYDIKPQLGAEGLGAFLRTERSDMACSDLPPDLVVSEPNTFQKVHRYLFATVAAIWAVFGVSWGGLIYLNAALFSLTLILCYRLSRLVLGSLVAWIPVVLFARSHLHLDLLPHLRDYAKAPFMLGVLWLTVLLVLSKTSDGRLKLAAALGLLAGVGMGFRMDILLMVPFVLTSVLLFSNISWSLPGMLQRIRILGLFGLVFFVAGAPILSQLGQGSNTLHVILLGLAPEFDDGLGLLPTAAYDLLERYDDTFLNSLLSLWNDPDGALLGLATHDYEAAGQQYLLRLVGIFPADFLLRTLSATLAIMFYGIPEVLRERMPVGWLSSLLVALPFLLCFVWACARSVRIGLFLLFATAYLFGSTVLQFSSRHWFYLQAAAFVFFVFASWLTLKISPVLWGQVRLAIRHRSLKAVELKPVWIAVTAVFALVIIFWTGFSLLRDYQVRHGNQILKEYQRLPVAGAPVIKEADALGVKYRVDLRHGDRIGADESVKKNSFLGAYLVAEFDPVRCSRKDVHFIVGYQSNAPYYDYSRAVTLDLIGRTKYYFSVFDFIANNYLHFDGVSMSKASSACLVSIDRVNLVPRGLPLLNLIINANTSLMPRAFPWQLPESKGLSYYANVNHYSDLYFEGGKAGMQGGQVDVVDPVLHMHSDQNWQLLGYPKGRNENLINFRADESGQEARIFLLAGKIKHGRLGIGLLENNAWAWSRPISRQGEFRVALRVPHGQKPVLVANGGNNNVFLDVDLNYAGWVDEIKH